MSSTGETQTEVIALVGGTGALGSGLALRLARAGHQVVIGSRDAAKAVEAAAALSAETGATLRGTDNLTAATEGDVIMVTVPFASQAATLAQIAPAAAGKVVVDATVPLKPPKVARVQLPAEGSAAAIAAAALGPEVRLVTAFHSTSAQKLRGGAPMEADVLVFGDDVAARETVVAIIGSLGLTGVHGGPLDNAVAAEAMTSVLISINRRYGVAEGAGIRITGIDRSGSA